MAAITAQGFADKNETIDWLRAQGFPFARASWLERIHSNGGRPIYEHAAAAQGRARAEPSAGRPAKPAPAPRAPKPSARRCGRARRSCWRPPRATGRSTSCWRRRSARPCPASSILPKAGYLSSARPRSSRPSPCTRPSAPRPRSGRPPVRCAAAEGQAEGPGRRHHPHGGADRRAAGERRPAGPAVAAANARVQRAKLTLGNHGKARIPPPSHWQIQGGAGYAHHRSAVRFPTLALGLRGALPLPRRAAARRHGDSAAPDGHARRSRKPAASRPRRHSGRRTAAAAKPRPRRTRARAIPPTSRRSA